MTAVVNMGLESRRRVWRGDKGSVARCGRGRWGEVERFEVLFDDGWVLLRDNGRLRFSSGFDLGGEERRGQTVGEWGWR